MRGSFAALAARSPRVTIWTVERHSPSMETSADRCEASPNHLLSERVVNASSATPLDLSVKCAPVAQWIEQLTSDHPGRCAVAPSVSGGA